MSRERSGLGVCVAGFSIFILNAASFAGLTIVSQSVSVDRADREVLFSLNFNRAPDFTTSDLYGRHADSFQYEIVPNTTQSIDSLPFEDIRAVIRGDEIGGGALPIRDGFENGSDPSPFSGGWGKILGTVPYSLQGSHLTFDAPFKTLNVTNANGEFAYRVFTTNYGDTVSSVASASIPLPSALRVGLVGLSILAGAGFIRRRIVAMR